MKQLHCKKLKLLSVVKCLILEENILFFNEGTIIYLLALQY